MTTKDPINWRLLGMKVGAAAARADVAEDGISAAKVDLPNVALQHLRASDNLYTQDEGAEFVRGFVSGYTSTWAAVDGRS